jgi:hypothetical protein
MEMLLLACFGYSSVSPSEKLSSSSKSSSSIYTPLFTFSSSNFLLLNELPNIEENFEPTDFMMSLEVEVLSSY